MLTNTLLDGGRAPTVRETIVRLMTCADSADLAIVNVRLAAVDLQEATTVCPTRLLIAQLDANFPADAAALVNDAVRLASLERLHLLTCSGRLQVRCAALQRWAPDFSVYRIAHEPPVLLLGAHYFQPLPGSSTTLTAVIRDRRLAERAQTHFDRLWRDGYDVLPTISEILAQTIDGRSVPARTSR